MGIRQGMVTQGCSISLRQKPNHVLKTHYTTHACIFTDTKSTRPKISLYDIIILLIFTVIYLNIAFTHIHVRNSATSRFIHKHTFLVVYVLVS